MEFIVIVGAVLLVIFVFKKLTRPTNSDKLTLLQLENWISIYSSGSLFEKSNMATALVVQSIIVANSMGLNISVNEFMREKNASKESSMDVVNHWLSCIFSEMVNDIPLEQINSVPARTVGGMLIMKMADPRRYKEILSG